MQDLQSTSDNAPRLTDTCASCGGDPGGMVWEGLVLAGLLSVDDIVALLHGALDHRGVVRLFTVGRLHGTKMTGAWMIRASQFLADWRRLEQTSSPSVRRRHARRGRIVEVVQR